MWICLHRTRPSRTLKAAFHLPLINSKPAPGLFGDIPAQDELLPPELAYLPQIMTANDRELIIRWQIEPGYYLYRDKLSFSLTNAGGAQVVNADIDPGIEQYDEFFGAVRILRDVAEARLILDPPADLPASGKASLQINYQGCADIGVCFPPSHTTLPVAFDSTPSGIDINATLGSSAASTGSAGTSAGTTSSEPVNNLPQSEQDRLFSMLGTNSLWLNVATFFGLGLLLAFTPCVLPMIPILSSLIVGQGDSMSTGRAFRLSLVYVLVMASTYAIVGVIVGLSGYNVQAFLQNPWVLSVIAVLFVVLSLSMFGFFELQMPAGIQNKLTQWSNKQGGGQVTGVAAMGFISTLIVGPCVTAPLAGALIYIAKTGDAVIGGAALFSAGIGYGCPSVADRHLCRQASATRGQLDEYHQERLRYIVAGHGHLHDLKIPAHSDHDGSVWHSGDHERHLFRCHGYHQSRKRWLATLRQGCRDRCGHLWTGPAAGRTFWR